MLVLTKKSQKIAPCTGVASRGSLARLINKADQMSDEEIAEMGRKAKKRVAEEYTWDKICGQYEDVFVGKINNG